MKINPIQFEFDSERKSTPVFSILYNLRVLVYQNKITFFKGYLKNILF